MFCGPDNKSKVLRLAGAACIAVAVGCGTTRTTDTLRTATEQLLVSDAIDRAVQAVNFRPLVGQTVFLDESHLVDVVDRQYLISTLRQHLLASGCVLRDDRANADFIVEARAGAIGTDRSDLLFGIPATNVPQILPIQAGPAAIPEVPLAKRRDQRGIAKISVFAYHRETGQPVWQSGLALKESSSNDVWLLGAGPFQTGTVYNEPRVLARSDKSKSSKSKDEKPRSSRVNLAQQATFNSPQQLVAETRRLPATEQVADTNEPPTSTTTVASEAAPVEPAPFVPYRDDDQEPLIPNLAELAAKKQKQAELTGRVYESQLFRSESPKTVKLTSPRETDPIELPTPRFDSL